jgi:hypothetical protein
MVGRTVGRRKRDACRSRTQALGESAPCQIRCLMMLSFRKLGRTRFGRGSPRLRHNDGGSPSRDPVGSSEPEGAGPPLRSELQDGGQVAQADLRRRPSDRAAGAALLHPVPRAGGHRRGLPPSHAPSAGRLRLRPAGHYRTPDALRAASLSQRHGISHRPSRTTVQRAKGAEATPRVTPANLAAIHAAREAAGVEFTDGEASGVRLRRGGVAGSEAG